MIRNTLPVLFTAGAAFAAAPFASAQLLAADSFLDGGTAPDGAAGEYFSDNAFLSQARLLTQAPTLAGFDASSWTLPGPTGPNTFPTSNFVADINTLDGNGVTYEQGGKAKFLGAAVDNLTRIVARSLDPLSRDTATTPISTYYMSGLVNPGSAAANKTGFALMGFTNALSDGRLTNEAGSANLFGAMWGFEGKGDNGFDLIVRSRQNTGTSGAPVFEAADTVILADAAENVTFNVVLKIDVNSNGGEDLITWWVDPTGPESAPAAAATGSFASFSMNAANEDNFDRASFAARNWGNTAFFDEFRLGLSFEDVTGFSGVSALVGDFDGSGAVGQADLKAVLLNWGDAVLPVGFVESNLGDGGPFDGNMSQNELNDVLLNWGNTAEATGSAVPEPATAALLGLGTLALLRRRPA